jgi:hypothetical protein
MELVSLLRVLWRRRLLLAAGAVLAVAAAVVVGGGTPSVSHIAWTRVQLDTPRSELVDSNPGGADTLSWRASLMTHLMLTEPVKHRLANALGVPEDQVAVVDPKLAMPLRGASLPKNAAEIAAINYAPYVLTTYLGVTALPMISIEAAAPDRASAVKLANAAVEIFKSQEQPVGTSLDDATATGPDPFKSPGDAFVLQGFVVNDIAPVRTKVLTTGAGPAMAIAAGVFVFGAWTFGVLVLHLLLRRGILIRRRVQPVTGA